MLQHMILIENTSCCTIKSASPFDKEAYIKNYVGCRGESCTCSSIATTLGTRLLSSKRAKRYLFMLGITLLPTSAMLRRFMFTCCSRALPLASPPTSSLKVSFSRTIGIVAGLNRTKRTRQDPDVALRFSGLAVARNV